MPFWIFRSSIAVLAASVVSIVTGTPVLAQERVEIPTLDGQFESIAELDNRFAGLYLRDDALVIRYVSRTGRVGVRARRRLARAIEQVFDTSLREMAETVVFEPARFPVSNLLDWKAASVDVLSSDDVIFLDVNEVQNTLTLGVSSEINQGDLIQRLASLGVPRDAVELEVIEPFLQQQNVRDRIRPLMGGVQIKFGSGARCTAGIVITLPNNQNALLTNSHCTNNQGGVESTLYKQPQDGFFGANRIGTEIADPTYTTISSLCPTGRVCRMSDSAAVELDSGVTATRGMIARIGSWGSRNISSADPDYEIVQSDFFPLSGQVVTKVGRTTGKTGGSIINTCIVTNVARTNITQICQYRVGSSASIGGGVTPFSDSGDSGSPVFSLLPSPNPSHDVSLTGLHWGGNGTTSVFSPFTSVFLELQQDIGTFQFIR